MVEAERVGGEQRGEGVIGGGIGSVGGGRDPRRVGRLRGEAEIPNEYDRARAGLEGRGKGGVEEGATVRSTR